MNGLRWFVAVRETPVSDTLAERVAWSLNGNRVGVRGDW